VNTIWNAADYLITRIRARSGQDSEGGALSLEWILIMVAVALAAGVVVAVFNKAISTAMSQLP
jgi:hypothetical protein